MCFGKMSLFGLGLDDKKNGILRWDEITDTTRKTVGLDMWLIWSLIANVYM